MLHACDAEIIPIEPDVGNAAEGIASIKTKIAYISVFYFAYN